jgi:hypothetical protein
MNIGFVNDTQLNVIFNNQAEQVLLTTGYDKMSTDDKNSLFAIIANKENMAFSDITSDHILTHHKNLKINLLIQLRDNAIHGGFTSSNGHTYRTNPDDQVNMIGQKIELMDDNTITTVMWRQEDVNDWVSHTASDWIDKVYKEAFSYKQSQMSKCKGLISDVSQATTHDAIVAITWG